ETGSRETGSRETGSRETGSRETGSRETGSRETGSRETGSREGDPRFDSAGRGGSFRGADPVWDTRRKVRRGASRAETLSPAGGTFHRSVSTNEDAGRREGFPVEEDGVAGVRNPANFGFLRAICVAQWIPRKGILDLVEAWRSLEASNASLRLIGDTDADPEYRSRVMEAIGEDASITVFGTLDDESLAAAYAESDFFVLPSRYEGYGIVYAEALSFGLPVVACDVGSVPEVVGREAGLFVGPGDAEGLAHAIYTLLSDGNLRCRMSDAAFRRVEILPRWDDTVRGFAEVLREAVGRG
ncbi:MAG: glycosyltransferase family 4 protein, partial [Actinomycetota bacterium]|nr:glycosyltransferase family 4 protein [Actinomycetota bacterium]